MERGRRAGWVRVGWAPLALALAFLLWAQGATAGSGWEVLAFGGVDVRALAVDRQDPNTVHIIAGRDTQMVSNDGGQTWRTAPSDARPFYVQDPNRPQTFFRWNPDSSPTGGIQRSADSGQTWSLVWRSPTGYARGYAVAAPPPSANVPSVVLASAFIDNSDPRLEGGPVLRTLDGGESWSQVQFPTRSTGYSHKFEAFTFDATRGVSYAAASGWYTTYGQYITVTYRPGLWKSTDYFQNDFVQLPLPSSVFEITAMTFSQGQLLLVGRERPPDPERVIFNVWQSPDGGKTWFPLFPSSLVYPGSPYLSSMVAWPITPTRILLGTSDGLWVRDLPTIQQTYVPWVASAWARGW